MSWQAARAPVAVSYRLDILPFILLPLQPLPPLLLTRCYVACERCSSVLEVDAAGTSD